MLSKQEELLSLCKTTDRDWSDIKHDSDVLMGRLLNNRIGYTLKEEISLILGLVHFHGAVQMKNDCLSWYRVNAMLPQGA